MIKDWYKKWQVWLGVAVALLLILGCVLGFSAASVANHRKAAIEDFVCLYEEIYPESYPKGSITWIDKDGIVEITREQADSDPSLLNFGIEQVREDQMTADMLAFEIGCPVITYDRLNDSSLFAIQIGYPNSGSRNAGVNGNQTAQSRINSVVNEARITIEGKQDELLQELCHDIKAVYGDTVSKASFNTDESAVDVSVVLAPGYSFAGIIDSTKEYWNNVAAEDSRILQKEIHFRFYSSDGVLQLEAGSPLIEYFITPRDVQLAESEM